MLQKTENVILKNKRLLANFIVLLASLLFSSCSKNTQPNVNYSFTVATDVQQSIHDFDKVAFSSDNNLDLGFYKGTVWIKLEIVNGKTPASFVVLCNDLINHNYRFYKLDKLKNNLITLEKGLDLEKYDHRSYHFSKPNFKIDLDANEKSTFLITTSSDGRILQATPTLISVNEFYDIKQQTLLIDIVFYSAILLLLLINLFYFKLVRNDIYYYYAAYILSGCLMYLFVEGRLYGMSMSNSLVDHLMFISIRIWVLFGMLFTLNFLETKTTNPKYYKRIITTLVLTLGLLTIYQLLFSNFSISTLHKLENIMGFVWIILMLITLGIAFKKRKTQSIYYLISYSIFLFFVTLGLIDSHTTMLPGDPFSYFKIGTLLEFTGFSYFITILIKQKLAINLNLEKELFQSRF